VGDAPAGSLPVRTTTVTGYNSSERKLARLIAERLGRSGRSHSLDTSCLAITAKAGGVRETAYDQPRWHRALRQPSRPFTGPHGRLLDIYADCRVGQVSPRSSIWNGRLFLRVRDVVPAVTFTLEHLRERGARSLELMSVPWGMTSGSRSCRSHPRQRSKGSSPQKSAVTNPAHSVAVL
jgi:hypothetical protein